MYFLDSQDLSEYSVPYHSEAGRRGWTKFNNHASQLYLSYKMTLY